MWTYSQSSGHLTDKDGVIVAIGYSGNGEWKNRPDQQHVRGHGPIPRGKYKIAGHYDSARVGKFALTLEPDPANEMHGRSAFRIHGDSIKKPGTASDGCIIIPRAARGMVWDSGDRVLMVVR